MKNIANITSVSQESLQKLEESGLDKYEVFKPVIRRVNGKIVENDEEFFIAINAKQDGTSRSKKLKIGAWKDLKEFGAYCSNCSELLGIFYSILPELDSNSAGIQIFSYHDGKHWYGTFGCNVNPQDGQVNFECCCGNKEIVHKGPLTVTKGHLQKEIHNLPRYTKYYIKEK